MEANIRLYHALRDYCRKNRIDLLEDESSRKMDYYLHQVLDQIEEINGKTPGVKRPFRNPGDETEPFK